MAKSAQSNAGFHCNVWLEKAKAVAVATGIKAAESVLGRAASNHAFKEFTEIIVVNQSKD